MLDTFYSTSAQVCFTLLGLWWVVVEFKHQDWMADIQRRRMAYDVSLYFLLPGIMSLISLLSDDANAKFLWRVAFGVTGLIGFVEVIFMLARSGTAMPRVMGLALSRWFVLALYGLITVIALFPELVGNLGIALRPIEVEALLLSLLVFLGVNFAWVLFAQPRGGMQGES
jgi:hypothetical protein